MRKENTSFVLSRELALKHSKQLIFRGLADEFLKYYNENKILLYRKRDDLVMYALEAHSSCTVANKISVIKSKNDNFFIKYNNKKNVSISSATELDSRGLQILMHAIEYYGLEKLKKIIELHRINLYAATDRGITAIHFAAQLHKYEKLQYLLSRIDKNKLLIKAETPIHSAIHNFQSVQNTKCIINMLTHWDINALDQSGKSALHIAIDSNLPSQFIKYLVNDLKAAIKLSDKNSLNPIDYALNKKNEEVFFLLFSLGSTPNFEIKKNKKKMPNVDNIIYLVDIITNRLKSNHFFYSSSYTNDQDSQLLKQFKSQSYAILKCEKSYIYNTESLLKMMYLIHNKNFVIISNEESLGKDTVIIKLSDDAREMMLKAVKELDQMQKEILYIRN